MIERRHTVSVSPEDVNFATVPVPRTQETLYVRLAWLAEPEARVTLGRDVTEPTDLNLDEAERLGCALLRAVEVGRRLYLPG